MARKDQGKRGTRAIFAALAIGALAISVPGAVLAVGDPASPMRTAETLPGLPFTPANVDRSLALKVARIIGSDGLRFTPASRAPRERTVTVAVRVDRATARAISVRKAVESVGGEARTPAVALLASRYNLGAARGYQSFVQPSKVATAGLRDAGLPDLAYSLEDGSKSKPSRFQSRIALEQQARTGRSAGSYDAQPEQSVDVSGSYRLTRNLGVTAGVRLSQERDRLAPMTDGVEDDKAVYVGTQIKF